MQHFRKNPNIIILASLWFSSEKPPLQFFLQPITEMLSHLELTDQYICMHVSYISTF